jgi:hypothetical protein
VKNDIKQRLPTLVLKLRECADSFKKLSDTEAITQQESDVKEQLNRIRRQFLGYVKSCYFRIQRESLIICMTLIHLVNSSKIPFNTRLSRKGECATKF